MMWKRPQLLVWWLVSAGAVSAGTAWLALRWHVSRQHEAAAGTTAHPSPLATIHEWLHAHAPHTPGQHASLDILATDMEKQRSQGRQELHLAEKELTAALRTGDGTSPALAGALEHISTAQVALHRVSIAHFLAVWNTLDTEQRRAFADWAQQHSVTP